MRIFDQIDHQRFRISKVQWNDDDRFTTLCIGLKPENDYSYIGDVRYLWPEAFFQFMQLVFPELFYDPRRKNYRLAIFSIIKPMYQNWFAKLKDRYGSLIDYEKPFLQHQYSCIWRMLPNKHTFLALEMGLGKTLLSATLSKILNIDRTLVVAPNGPKWNWFHDLVDDWGFDSASFTILDSRPQKCRYAFMEKFVVMNYEAIPKHLEYLIGPRRNPIGHIIIDESHLIKNHNILRYRNIEKIIKAFPDSRVTLLSGTPVTNRVNDMFAYFKITGHLLGKNHSEFMRRYVKRSNGFKGKIIGAQNLNELRARYSNFIIRKRTEECIDLPELQIKKLYLDESEITQEYKDTLRKMYEQRAERALLNVPDDSSLKNLEESFTSNIHTLNRILSTTKAKLVIPIIEELWEAGKKVIVFSTYISALEALEKYFDNKCVLINGSVNAFERSKRIEKFKKDKNCHVFLGNVKAAGVGINLVNASNVIFLNFPFTPDDIEQPQKRSHRMGQKENVLVQYTIVKNSIDEHIYQIIVDKSGDINELLDKNKPGVIDYKKIGNIANAVYKKLMNQYAIEHGLPVIQEVKFAEI